MKKILNLYAGLGGIRKKWKNVKVTAVELDSKIAAVYKKLYPLDDVIVADAEQYLLDHYTEFDAIFLGPPCQGNTRMIRSGKNRKPRFPDLTLYKLLIFLKHNYKGFYLIENVIPYYKYLIKPSYILGRHAFWCNFELTPFEIKSPKNFINTGTVKDSEYLKNELGIHYEGNLYYNGNHDPCQVLRNCVHPDLGEHLIKALQRKWRKT